MLREIRSRSVYLVAGAAIFVVGFFVGGQYESKNAEAQAPRRFGNIDVEGVEKQWATGFGFAIPAEGGALVRGEEGRAYVVTADGKVSELSIGDGPRTPTPLRPK